MKNKIIIIFLISLFNLSYPSFLSAEEFKFEATELQVTESGNLIKGFDRGIITTKNNEIVITADTFIYNKFTTLLEAEGNVKIVDKIKDIIIESNKTFYLKNKEEIFTIGKSKAIRGTDIQIDANQYFKYNKFTSLIEAKGDVVLDDRIEDVTIYTDEIFYLQNEEKITTLGETNIDVENEYKIKGRNLTLLRNKMILSSNEKATITDYKSNIYKLSEFEYSINQEILKGKNINHIRKEEANKEEKYFFQTGFFNLKENKFLGKEVNIKLDKKLFENEKNDPRINAVTGYGNQYNTYLDKGVFTSCKKTDKCPPWKMTASKIHHDKIKKQIIYRDAWLELYDFPVVYFPKFFHPDPSVVRQSGLLRPEISDHSSLGDSMYLPYFFVISDKKDITLKPRLFNSGTFIVQSEYRQITENSLTIIDSSITRSHDSSTLDRDDSRSHFFVNSKIDLNLEKFKNSDLVIHFEKASNDNYLKLFDFMKSPLLLGNNNSVLDTFINLKLDHEDYYFTTSFEIYESLSGSNSDRYQYVLPAYNFTKSFDFNEESGSFYFNSSGSNVLHATNVVSSKIINDLNFTSLDSFSNKGLVNNFGILTRNINSVGKNSIYYKNSPQSELIGMFNYNLSMPLRKNYKNIIDTLIPRVSFKFNPNDMKNHANSGRRIDINNIFAPDRLGLGDSFETGESLTVGVDFIREKINEIDEIEDYLDFRLATVFRFKEEKNIPIGSTINKKTSNIVGKINYEPNENILLNYNFSLKNNLNTLEYNAITSQFSLDNFSTKFNYIEERGVIGNANIIENTTKFNFDEYNSFSFKTRRNRKLNLTEYYDLIYEYKNDCLIADIKYRKDYYNDADIIPKEELFFSITIVPFYTYSPDKMILNKNRID